MKTTLIWFRSDLRIGDHPALDWAYQHSEQLIGLYIDSPRQWDKHGLGETRRAFLNAHVECLQHAFESAGYAFHRLHCDTFDQVPDKIASFIVEHGIDVLAAHREFGIYEDDRDRAVSAAIGIPFYLLEDQCVVPAASLLNQQQRMFQVFTPFRNAWLRQIQQSGFFIHDRFKNAVGAIEYPVISAVSGFTIGEHHAVKQLNRFCQQALAQYAESRDLPAQDGGSRLSPYLSIGALSSRQCLSAVVSRLGNLPLSPGERGFAWINEIAWRDFYRHLMRAYPRLSKNQAFKPATDLITWNRDNERFERWCRGETGYPIVDAAIRCLNQSGWMHNRLRMISASFLVKDLQIDWRWGERYFMQQLIDADFPSNNGGWQWSAGTGADSAPYFRIFNPTTQGKRFDPAGEFVKRWIPELSDVPPQHIHDPHRYLEKQGIENIYVGPIVDHAVARQKTLEMFKAVNQEKNQ